MGPIPEASVDDAIADLTLAEQGFRDRGRVYRQTWHNLALCFQLKSELGKARAYATEAASQPMRTVLDRIEQRKIEALLGQLG